MLPGYAPYALSHLFSLSRMVLEDLDKATLLQIYCNTTLLFYNHPDLVRNDVFQYETKIINICFADWCCKEAVPLFQY